MDRAPKGQDSKDFREQNWLRKQSYKFQFIPVLNILKKFSNHSEPQMPVTDNHAA